MKYFKMNEFLDSETAKRNGVVNMFACAEHIDNVLAMVDDILDPLREMFGKSILINSGYRVPALNRLVGGSVNSMHMVGMAVDITAINPIENMHLYNMLVSNFEFDQVIIYVRDSIVRFIHISYCPNGGNRHQVIRRPNFICEKNRWD